MNHKTMQHFKERLEALLSELRATVEEKTDSTATVDLDTSIGRISRIDAIQSQQIALGLRARQQQSILRVISALQAIRDGTYGQCRRCKGAIAVERLEVQPDAVLCIGCAAKAVRKP